MKPVNMEQLMSNRPIRKVVIGRCIEIYTLGVNVDSELASASWPTTILFDAGDYVDENTCFSLHLLDESSNRRKRAAKSY